MESKKVFGSRNDAERKIQLLEQEGMKLNVEHIFGEGNPRDCFKSFYTLSIRLGNQMQYLRQSGRFA